MTQRDLSAELGLGDALRARMRGIGSLTMVLRIAVATTVSYLLAERYSGSALPVFAPITTLLVVQTSAFSTLGITAQRVLGTGLGVGVATLYVSVVPVTWWSVLLALLVSLLVARLLPFGMAGQMQIPLATVFVLALGPADLAVDLWRVADVVLGGAIGVLAVFLAPPRPQLAPVRDALDALRSAIADLLDAMGREIGTFAAPLPPEARHAFIADGRELPARIDVTVEALALAVESVRFNPRARRVGTELDLLDQRTAWLRHVTIQVRGLGGAVDRLYDRPGIAPALPAEALRGLLDHLAALLVRVDTVGSDEVVGERDVRLGAALRAEVTAATSSYDAVEALASLSVLGRVDHLRTMIVAGPHHDVPEVAPEDDLGEAVPSLGERLRALLGRT